MIIVAPVPAVTMSAPQQPPPVPVTPLPPGGGGVVTDANGGTTTILPYGGAIRSLPDGRVIVVGPDGQVTKVVEAGSAEVAPFTAVPPPIPSLPASMVVVSLAALGMLVFVLYPVARALSRFIEARAGRATPKVETELAEIRRRLEELAYDRAHLAELEERLEFTERLIARRPEPVAERPVQ